MSQDLEQRVAVLEAVIAGIRAVFGAGAIGVASKAAHTSEAGEVATDDLLNRDWADMEVRRDPKRWNGPSQVGKRMSECPADFLLEYASFHEWAANKSKSEPEPRLDNKGRPWYERDFLIAKLARGFAKRNGAKPVAAAVAAVKAAPRPKFDEPEEDVPF
jgi:hypothetical protein